MSDGIGEIPLIRRRSAVMADPMGTLRAEVRIE